MTLPHASLFCLGWDTNLRFTHEIKVFPLSYLVPLSCLCLDFALIFVLSCLVLFCLVLSCLVLSCLVLSCLVLSCLVFVLVLVFVFVFFFGPSFSCPSRVFVSFVFDLFVFSFVFSCHSLACPLASVWGYQSIGVSIKSIVVLFHPCNPARQATITRKTPG